MNNMRSIKRKIKKLYGTPIKNIYSSRFLTDLFTGYSYSLSKDSNNRIDFFQIIPNDKEILELFINQDTYNFSYKLGQIIDRVLYSMAVHGKSYIFIKPEYIEKIDEEGNVNKVVNALKMDEVKGVLQKEKFYYMPFDDGIHDISISEGTFITFDLKEMGYKRNYFKKIAKKIGENDLTSISWELIKNEPTYDFKLHLEKNINTNLKLVKGLGWSLITEGLSDSYILYNQIQMKLFKIKMLNYVLEKINKALVDKYIDNKDFKIEASIDNLNYEDTREKFQTGEITKSDLSKIVWG